MLNLMRKEGQSVLIGEDVEVMVNWIRERRVSLEVIANGKMIKTESFQAMERLTVVLGKNANIFIGKDIDVMVTKLSSKQIHLGIKAPRELLILRDDVANRSKQNNF